MGKEAEERKFAILTKLAETFIREQFIKNINDKFHISEDEIKKVLVWPQL